MKTGINIHALSKKKKVEIRRRRERISVLIIKRTLFSILKIGFKNDNFIDLRSKKLYEHRQDHLGLQ